jgi:hypothetical protein
LPILDNRRQKQLLAQWKAYRAAMDSTDPPPSKLDFGALSVASPVGGEVEATAQVSATWWGVDGRALSYESQARTWRIDTREEHGWQVSRVEAPAWCGGYVLASKCRKLARRRDRSRTRPETATHHSHRGDGRAGRALVDAPTPQSPRPRGPSHPRLA